MHMATFLKLHSLLWRTIEDSQSTVSRDNLDVICYLKVKDCRKYVG